MRRLYVPLPDIDAQSFDKDAILTKIKEAQKSMLPVEATLLTTDSKTSHGFLLRDDRINIPKSETQIKLDLLIMSHCGPAGHRGQAVTANHVKDKFTWSGIAADIKTFVNKCFHCHRVPFGRLRPKSNPVSSFFSWSVTDTVFFRFFFTVLVKIRFFLG